jgi:VIT1/CCC1 family predicted Fe2+/Mn2+ transporter
MRGFAALISSLSISLLALFRFGTTLAKKKDGRVFFGRHI